jgi:uncharacterized protein (DUF3084 family)
VCAKAGEVGGYVAIDKDIIERNRVLEEIQRQREELESVNEELQPSNEELTASNEELASAKEELRVFNGSTQEYAENLEHMVEERTRRLLDSNERFEVFMNSARA